MRLSDIRMAFPYILLALAMVAGLGPGLRHAMIAIAIVGFPICTRLVRGIVLSVGGREFVEAVRALGSPDRLILVRHIVPQLISPVVAAFRLAVGAPILAPAGLSSQASAPHHLRRTGGSMLATRRPFGLLRWRVGHRVSGEQGTHHGVGFRFAKPGFPAARPV